MSSKAMLSVIPQAMCIKFPVVLHMDCTFKCNDNEFPILKHHISPCIYKEGYGMCHSREYRLNW